MHTSPTEPNTEDMAAAWAQLRQPDWPPLAEILANARRYQLVRGAALRRSRGELPAKAAAEHSAAAVQTPARPAPARAVPLPHHPPLFDHKRAAAGERADD